MKPLGKHLQIILTKMHTMVGLKKLVNFKDNEWYYKHSWTMEDEDKFIEWLSVYLMKNQEARNELMLFPTKRKYICSRFAEMFAFQYGWRLITNDKEARNEEKRSS